MNISRRDFGLTSLALLSLPIFPGRKASKRIVSLRVDTHFNLEQVFERGQLSLYELWENKPTIDVNVEYEDGSKESYVSHEKIWRKAKWYERNGLMKVEGNRLRLVVDKWVCEISNLRRV